VLSCDALGYIICENYKQYEVLNFPDGNVESTLGTTEQKQENCWRVAECVRDIVNGQFICFKDNYGAWLTAGQTKQKVYVSPEVEPVCEEALN